MYAPNKSTQDNLPTNDIDREVFTTIEKLLAALSALSVVILLTGAIAFITTRPTSAEPRATNIAGNALTSSPSPTPVPGTGSRAPYRLRCWQFGRLVVDEPLAALPADTPGTTIHLQGGDGSCSTYTLIDTRTSTCLVKPVAAR